VVKAISNQLSVALDNARLYERVKHLSIHDPLTGLLNRNVLYERMDEELSRAQRFGEVLGVAVVDIDRFKRINDQFGHVAGDQVLREIAARLKKNMRGSDVVARFGGDEFVVLLTHTSVEGATIALERLREYATYNSTVLASEGGSETVTLSMGVAFWTPETSLTATQLIAEADRALYRAKEAGRNRMAVAEPGTPTSG
jgi:diguanylate cyclase (GGDEF)-like protein